MKFRMFGSMAVVAALLTGMAGGAMADPNEKSTQTIAIAGTAVSAYLLSKPKTRTAGAVAAAGTAYAWKKHADAVNQRHDREKANAYYAGRSNNQRYSSSGRDNGRYRAVRASSSSSKSKGKYKKSSRRSSRR